MDTHPTAAQAPPTGQAWLLLALLLALLGGDMLAYADEADERRVRIGLRLFRTLLAADLDLAAKVDPQGHLPLLLLYHDDRALAERFAAEVFPAEGELPHGKIQALPVRVILSNDTEPQIWQAPAAIFLLQPLPQAALERVIRYSHEHPVIVFSPFEGHVERGVLAGVAIEAKVLPYLNLRTLQASGLHLKALFLKIAKQHE
jgi:hypothetical protein